MRHRMEPCQDYSPGKPGPVCGERNGLPMAQPRRLWLGGRRYCSSQQFHGAAVFSASFWNSCLITPTVSAPTSLQSKDQSKGNLTRSLLQPVFPYTENPRLRGKLAQPLHGLNTTVCSVYSTTFLILLADTQIIPFLGAF